MALFDNSYRDLFYFFRFDFTSSKTRKVDATKLEANERDDKSFFPKSCDLKKGKVVGTLTERRRIYGE